MDTAQMRKTLSTLGKTMGGGLLAHAREASYAVPAELSDQSSPPSAEETIACLRSIAGQFFPCLVSAKESQAIQAAGSCEHRRQA
jgi:hypothetical protein